MANKLQQYFPMIRTKEEILQEIRSREELLETYEKWNEEQQEDFLDMCTGVKGVKLLYDSFFKEIMDPDATPERLEELLSLILGEKVIILKVLPNDSQRIADEQSLVILDIVVQLTDGRIADVEVQKIGHAFPGQRCACYSADLLLRQYKRIRSSKRKEDTNFSYSDIQKVYTIVLFEKSTKEFQKYKHTYIHHSRQQTDTGVNIELLQEYTFITLDIFRSIIQNNGVRNKLEAWLAFLSMDDPEMIIFLSENYPQFRQMYEEVYAMCRSMEDVMSMYSRELAKADRCNVQYMIDEMQNVIDEQKTQLNEQKTQLNEQKIQLDEKDMLLGEKDKQLDERDNLLGEKDAQIDKQNSQISELSEEIKRLKEQLDAIRI